MKKFNNDNELDRAFRHGLDDIEVEPSDSFWKKAEADILHRENISYRKNIFRWKLFSGLLSVLLIISGFFLFRQHEITDGKINRMKSSVEKTEAKNIVKEAKKQEIAQVLIPDNKSVNRKEIGNVLIGNEQQPKATESNVLKEETVVASHTDQKSVKNVVENSLSTEKDQAIQATHMANTSSKTSSSKVNADQPNAMEMKNNGLIADSSGDKKEFKEEVSSVEVQAVQTVSPSLSSENANSKEIAVKLPTLKDSALHANVGSSGQKANEIEKPFSPANFMSRISMMVYFAPSHAYQYLKDGDESDNIDVDDLTGVKSKKMAYNTGLRLSCDLNYHWTIHTGLNYYVSSFALDPKTVYAHPGKNGHTVYSYLTGAGPIEIRSDATTIGDSMKIDNNSSQTFQYLNIPLCLSYNYYIKRFTLFATAGVSANFLLRCNTRINDKERGGVEDDDDSSEKIEGLEHVNYGFICGIGARYAISKNYFISAAPMFSGNINTINKSYSVKDRPYNLGFEFGFGYHF
ncbi:MAG TPA: outer membrane beta-barrel protein [Bacteroidia bacterium]